MTDNQEILDTIKINVPNKPEYVSVVRLTTSAIANKIGFNIEEIDDIKVAIAEACTKAINNGIKNKNINIEFEIHSNAMTIITEYEKDKNIESSKEAELGLFIIQSLMDKVELVDANDIYKIKMIKEIEDVVK
ncbi:ATP-binding protein [Dethiothermospora halolimnae]|uniref:ATP-binding protein n=1 Tax=Dethiothermospora halolimnae TaxID=3114390 RepID=UPI003CCC035A